MKVELEAITNFGLEAVLKRELEGLAYEDIKVSDGLLSLRGNLEDIGRLNLWLRTAERVHLVLARFPAYTFDQLYENTKKIPWADFIPRDGNFITDPKSQKSKLYSLSDIQRIVEKALVDKLNQTYHQGWFEKTGPRYRVGIRIFKDEATLFLDTSGEGLHDRGYRQRSVEAPLTETMASALVQLSFWKPDRMFLDPFCGSGTLPIEAALLARNIAPGLNRSFDFEAWPFLRDMDWKGLKKEAFGAINYQDPLNILATDINPRAIRSASYNVGVLGLEDDIRLEVKDIRDLEIKEDYGVIITNPPYGVRIEDEASVKKLNQALGRFMKAHPTWSTYAISGAPHFERDLGKKADRKRKLYNGRIRTDYYQYYGPKPKRS
ncbi:MAG: class I SAM-dependent RNA methyltransferase [Tissierellia bacterium]|nr:class I SAM-dependent RNA methyltransferase [Tissierellia bacterium]